MFEPSNVADNSIHECPGIILHLGKIHTDKPHGIFQIEGIIRNVARIFIILFLLRSPDYTE
jgi:hypothetical protein